MDGIIIQKNDTNVRVIICITLDCLSIFEAVLNDGFFLDDWKKGNIVPVPKKDLQNILNTIVL